ncbi:DUF3540 domain-containing protein [Sorangium sp. So ce124]|uniref:DUF3540 domain-containing protein n=1 Tax=Sorangium sp. So ce124 TaxID=3133280 RepID=UPI003F61C418
MTQAARKIRELPAPRPDDYLGPGRVVRVGPREIEVEIRGGERVAAQMALAFPYAPEVDDVLLVIGRDDEHYVIGVLRGTGKASLSFQGAVDLRAQGGPLTLTSDQGVAIRSPAVAIEAGKLQMFAGSVVQKFTSLYQRVRDAMDLRAGTARTVVDEQSYLTAKNASIVTQETMAINGREIHLG